MNKKLLESFMKKYGDTGKTLSEHIGISRTTFSAKINETRAEFTQVEIALIKDRYSLTAEEVCDNFFDSKVSCLDTKREKGEK